MGSTMMPKRKMTFLSELIERVNKIYEVIVIADLNDNIGKEINKKVVRKCGEKIRNDNGKTPMKICKEHKLVVANLFIKNG